MVLEDDKDILSADNVVPVFRERTGRCLRHGLLTALDSVSDLLTTQDLLDFAIATDIGKEEPADVAAEWLGPKGLI